MQGNKRGWTKVKTILTAHDEGTFVPYTPGHDWDLQELRVVQDLPRLLRNDQLDAQVLHASLNHRTQTLEAEAAGFSVIALWVGDN